MGKKKNLLNKKNSQKFTLVHRSQRDPLQADESSTQRVLIPIKQSDSVDDDKIKYGVFFDDDYDYMQHLRTRQGGEIIFDSTLEEINYKKKDEKVAFGKVLLPKEVLPSNYEEKEGMLSKGILPRGPQPDWDPDIVAALDDDVDLNDPENFLEDDFVIKANSTSFENFNEVNNDDDEDWETESEFSYESDINSENAEISDGEFNHEQDDVKSRFTNYSMTSSVIRRTNVLKTLDDHFEKIMEEYDENNIGCIDNEDVSGNATVNNDLIKHTIEEFLKSQKKCDLADVLTKENEKIMYSDTDSEIEDEELFKQFDKKPKDQWDCESVISTYSNLYNHPKIIKEESKKPPQIRLHKHTGMPVGVLQEHSKHNEKNDNKNEYTIQLSNVRDKNETNEEKKLRKQAVKEHRKNRREEKKKTKLAFKNEFKIQEKVAINTNSQKGIKL
ncbi:protein LTV1 homolog [Hydra vulgaris]|uniref:protein LTV1 homolog n=1 Tax=Hydra vulgaris TaxID=6087 RepID=UPI0001925C47|nr:protein LTV1 homolog [Hydra vulgaris]